MWKKGYIWNPATFSCENDKYVESIIGDSVITCAETTEKAKNVPTKITSTKTAPRKSTSIKTVLTKPTSRSFYILLVFY